jgi:hypothetical protein
MVNVMGNSSLYRISADLSRSGEQAGTFHFAAAT